jgi:hypothetical protein
MVYILIIYMLMEKLPRILIRKENKLFNNLIVIIKYKSMKTANERNI